MHVRTKTGAALVMAAALANGAESIGTRLLLPPKPEGTLEALELVAAHRPTYAALVTVGTLAVPLMAAAFWVMTAVARERTPRLAMAARALLMAGMWGFLGMHVVLMSQVPLSGAGVQEAGAAALDAIQGSPLMGVVFMLPFLAGCTLGMVLLALGILKTRVLPRWIGAAWLLFILVDFTVGAVGPVDPHWLFLAGSVGAAVAVLRSSRRAGATAA